MERLITAIGVSRTYSEVRFTRGAGVSSMICTSISDGDVGEKCIRDLLATVRPIDDR